MSARDAELLEDEVRTLQARLAELEEDLRRTKLDAYQTAERLAVVAIERDALAAYLRALITAAEQRAAAAKPARPNWQCSGCSWGFDGPLQKTCPCCDREHYWTGSVFAGAVRWDGSRGTCAPEPADVGEP
jgi:rubrerythrin